MRHPEWYPQPSATKRPLLYPPAVFLASKEVLSLQKSTRFINTNGISSHKLFVKRVCMESRACPKCRKFELQEVVRPEVYLLHQEPRLLPGYSQLLLATSQMVL
jgi:hypothetical protein